MNPDELRKELERSIVEDTVMEKISSFRESESAVTWRTLGESLDITTDSLLDEGGIRDVGKAVDTPETQLYRIVRRTNGYVG